MLGRRVCAGCRCGALWMLFCATILVSAVLMAMLLCRWVCQRSLQAGTRAQQQQKQQHLMWNQLLPPSVPVLQRCLAGRQTVRAGSRQGEQQQQQDGAPVSSAYLGWRHAGVLVFGGHSSTAGST
jgi:hypothetical protein